MQKTIYSFAFISRRGIIDAMRFQPFIVPGWKDSGPGHWQTRWEQCVPHAQRVRQPDWETPDPAVWNATVAAYVGAAACQRTAERRVGNECVSTGKYRGSPYH